MRSCSENADIKAKARVSHTSWLVACRTEIPLHSPVALGPEGSGMVAPHSHPERVRKREKVCARALPPPLIFLRAGCEWEGFGQWEAYPLKLNNYMCIRKVQT